MNNRELFFRKSVPNLEVTNVKIEKEFITF